ncbi:MAG: EamA family transporter [Spirochaetes bacterium]|nr:EamA family transporter [Spirochaetota bacterium]
MASVLLALLSIVLWSSLAVLGSRVVHLPPLFTVGISLTLGGLAGFFRARDWRVPASTFLLGVSGLFGYHFLLFTAFRLAPAVEVNLLNYLWPLLIVVLSPVYLSGYRLRARHVAGAILGLSGAVFVISGGGIAVDPACLPGYLLAAAAAFTWASYSLLTKRVRPFPTAAVGGFCLASGLLSLACFAVEFAASPAPLSVSGADWIVLALLGLGPMGAAFYAWDAAIKRGDPRIIGSLAYLTPLLSTLNLVAFGGKRLTATSAAAMVLIVAGAVTGSFASKREPGDDPHGN